MQAQKNYDHLVELIQGVNDKLEAFDGRLNDIEKKTDALDLRLSQQGKALNVAQNDITDLQRDKKVHDTSLNDMKKLLDNALQEVEKLREWNNKLERFSRRNNMRLIGVEEKADEDAEKLVKDILKDKFNMTNAVIERAHRVGPPGGEGARTANRPRHILFKLLNYKDKVEILKQKREKLNGEQYFMTDDQTDEDMATKRRLKPVIDKAKQERKKWRFTQGKLWIEGQLYRERPEDRAESQNDRRNGQNPN